MGAPKQKWTSEEEAALKAGVRKHGSGKWQTILRDPEFSNVLRSRSNVDLKDKWRNINVTLSGLGSREKARLALKRNPQIPKHEDKLSLVNKVTNDEKDVQVEPVVPPSEAVQVANLKKTYTRLENHILEAITTLKEPKGSDRTAIAMYIEDRYLAPPNVSKLLASKLKFMTLNGQLLKVKRRYKISISSPFSETKINSPSDGKHKELRMPERKDLKIFTMSEVVADLEKMKSLSPHEAAAAAARAVAEAEAAIAEAEKAAREAEVAETEAEAAQAFAEAAIKALKCQKLCAC